MQLTEELEQLYARCTAALRPKRQQLASSPWNKASSKRQPVPAQAGYDLHTVPAATLVLVDDSIAANPEASPDLEEEPRHCIGIILVPGLSEDRGPIWRHIPRVSPRAVQDLAPLP